MAKVIDILTTLQIEHINGIGLYRDSDCLYLQVTGGGDRRLSKSWIYRFHLNGRRRRHMGLGPFALVSLADARRKVLEYRCNATRNQGGDLDYFRWAHEIRQGASRPAHGPRAGDCRAVHEGLRRALCVSGRKAGAWGAEKSTLISTGRHS